MIKSFKKLVSKLPVISRIKEKQIELDRREVALNQRHEELNQGQVRLNSDVLKFETLIKEFQRPRYDSIDDAPWRHPYLTEINIARLREYSEAVWQFALDYSKNHFRCLKIAFVNNMAQNMHKWARLAQQYGAQVGLFPDAADTSALSCPEWEIFEGEYPDVLDGSRFLRANSNLNLEVPCYHVPLDAGDLHLAYQGFCRGDRKSLLQLLARSPELRHEILFRYKTYYRYYQSSQELSHYDVIYAAFNPFAAYASGRPYCMFSVGGDLQYVCGGSEDYAEAFLIGFNAAKFILASNPHTLGHSRRLGLTNCVYLPYPMDDSRYSPGKGDARKEWDERYGKGIYVLTTSRLDDEVKGHDETFFQVLRDTAKQYPELHFIFLSWGNSANAFRSRVEASGLSNQFVVLNPVGKKRLIDYYRSCDIVLDHFVYGYYGVTTLEAAAIGKPVVMKLRKEHYGPLYKGDVAPVMNAASASEMGQALRKLVHDENFRRQQGIEMRNWLLRNHGEEKTVPLMLALLRLAADRVPLPPNLVNPLWDPESEAEKTYHAACLRETKGET